MSDVLVLCYHAVSPTWDSELSVTPEDLERQIAYLLSQGWHAATFLEAVLDPPAARTLAVTFDDAFASVREHGAPILESLRAPATVFAPTAYLDRGGPLSWPGIDHWLATPSASELSAMTWDELGELGERGWEIGSHTRTHPRLTQLDDTELTLELEQSRADCLRHLGRACMTIAYPYGDVDPRVADRARQLGYLAGAALSPALSSRLDGGDPHRHPRVGIYHRDAWWRFRLKSARPSRLWFWASHAPG